MLFHHTKQNMMTKLHVDTLPIHNATNKLRESTNTTIAVEIPRRMRQGRTKECRRWEARYDTMTMQDAMDG